MVVRQHSTDSPLLPIACVTIGTLAVAFIYKNNK
jgi:hypothetical protein